MYLLDFYIYLENRLGLVHPRSAVSGSPIADDNRVPWSPNEMTKVGLEAEATKWRIGRRTRVHLKSDTNTSQECRFLYIARYNE